MTKEGWDDKDNRSAFSSSEYDKKIKQTLPYYDDFYAQIIELVKTVCGSGVKWLDVGCGTGKMGSVVFNSGIDLDRFVFCDSSEEMIKISNERFKAAETEFCLCDVRELPFVCEFDVVTAVQVFHYFRSDDRMQAVRRCYDALKENGLFVTFENFAPFTDIGRTVYLEKWKSFQIRQGKTEEESRKHIQRYGTDYYPITVEEHLELLRSCRFKTVEILWLSNMQIGLWGRK